MNAVSQRAGTLALPLLLLLTVAAALAGMAATGALAPAELVPASPLVTWGLPAVRALHHLGLLLAIGAGGTAVLLLPGPGRREVTTLDPLRRRTVRLGAAGALLWAVASLALIPLVGLEATGAGTDLNVWDVALGGELGRIQLTITVFAALSALAYAIARSTVMACWGLAFAGIGAAALGLAGHAGSSLDHVNAVNAMSVHLVAVSVWAGGLLVLFLLSARMDETQVSTVIRRFSPWALAAVAALALSGLISAWIRMSHWSELLTTGYGRVVLFKAAGLLALAVLGALQRRRLGERIRFRHLVMTEGLVMAAVIGASIALGRSAPPVPQEIPAVGELRVLSMVGYLPPEREFGPGALFTVFQPDWIALALAATMAVLYLIGVVRLTRRGDVWPWIRTACFLAGCLAFAWVMNGGAAAWGKFRFDAHMIQHMAMMMIVPPLWALGGPVTLLSRAVAPRTDGSRGVREWVLAALHSGYSRLVSSPPVAGFIFVGSLVIFYFSPLFELAMEHHVGHLLMTVHFLASGYLFAWVLIGIDPSQKPINPVLKLITLLVTLAFHAFFGVAMVSATWLVAEGWYTQLGMYSPDRLELIQVRGGTIMWAISEVPTVGYAIIVAAMWMKSDDRRARQYDRKAERDGGAELAAYNAYLAGLRGDRGASTTEDIAETPGVVDDTAGPPAAEQPRRPADDQHSGESREDEGHHRDRRPSPPHRQDR